MTDSLVKRLEELRAKATPGPWSSCGQDGVPRHCIQAQVWDSEGKSLACVEPTEDAAEATANAALIVELVNNLPTILAALSAQEGMGWQPIETAPKDGTPVLVCEDDYVDVAQNFYLVDLKSKDVWTARESSQVVCQPTHWQPLPSAPLTAPQTQEGVSDE